MRDDERDLWVDASITSFLDGDTEGAQADELPPREAFEGPIKDVMDVPGFQRYCAWIDGQLVGTATLRIDHGLAQLCGAATLPASADAACKQRCFSGGWRTRPPPAARSR